MINVTKYDNIEKQTTIKVIASYKGFENYVPKLDNYVNTNGVIGDVNINVMISFPDNAFWWYPLFSVYFEGDTMSANIDNIKIGNNYKLMHDLSKFHIDVYRYSDLLISKYNEYSVRDIFNNYWYPSDSSIGRDVKVLQVIPVRPEFNDIIVLCQIQDGRFTYLPITTLFLNTPNLGRRKFVYEFNQWKDS